MKRGLTLIEVLAALCIFSMLVIGAATWTQTAVRSVAECGGPVRWRSAADMALETIERDIAIGDFEFPRDSAAKPRSRVEVTSGRELRIKTRSNGETAFHVYEFDPLNHSLDLVRRNASGSTTRRLLLEGINHWECHYDLESKLLTIELGMNDSIKMQRRYLVR